MKKLLILPILLLSGCMGSAGLIENDYKTPIPAQDYPVTYNQHSDAVPATVTTAFIGDSYVYYGAWQTWFPGSVNDGFGGCTVGQILAQVQAMPSVPPKVYLWCGINDLQTAVNRQVTMANYKALIDTVRAKGATTVICLSPLPLAPQYPWATNHNLGPADFGTLAIQLQDVAVGEQAQWINLWPAVALLTGWCDPQYSQPAGIHLNEAGYDRVVALLQSEAF